MSDWIGPTHQRPAPSTPERFAAEPDDSVVGRARAWSGSHLVLDWIGDQALAVQIASQSRPRFALSGQVAIDPMPNSRAEAEA